MEFVWLKLQNECNLRVTDNCFSCIHFKHKSTRTYEGVCKKHPLLVARADGSLEGVPDNSHVCEIKCNDYHPNYNYIPDRQAPE